MSTNVHDYINKLLKMKKINEKYIFFFNEIIDFIENTNDIEEIHKELNALYVEHYIFEENYDLEVINLEKIKYKNQILRSINEVINKKIINDCSHEFIEDYIDIFPDKIQKIVYCKFCENNLEYCNKIH